MKRVPDDTLEFAEDLVYYHEGVRFTGIAFEEDDGRVLSECSYLDGLQDGPARSWYESGQLEAEIWYEKNSIHGSSREWYPNGQLKSEKLSEHGIALETREWDESGNLIRETRLDSTDPNYKLLTLIREQLAES